MEYQDAKKLRENWSGQPCDHSCIEKEYYGDTFTLDYVCSQCGTEFNLLEMLEVKYLRRKSKRQEILHSS
ncbi:MAG: hypothetical protein AB9846_18390 [Tenuifilaceae bacterium]